MKSTNDVANYHAETCTHWRFSTAGGTQEVHFLLSAPRGLDIEACWAYLREEARRVIFQEGMAAGPPLFQRLFFSDICNQLPVLEEAFPEDFNEAGRANISLIEQPPLNGGKLAVWMYFVHSGDPVQYTSLGNRWHSNGRTHLWTANLRQSDPADPYGQSEAMFIGYEALLNKLGGTLRNDAVRTWLFARDICSDYAEIARARTNLFARHGLTRDTHYIASTGIAGKSWDPGQKTLMDVYSVLGLQPGQKRHLHAPDHLCSTSLYDVTFERGTELLYGDRKHVFISGTASIDRHGAVVHPYRVLKQLQRTIENMAALLADADCALTDLACALVYLRDPADYEPVRRALDEWLPSIPGLILLAPICRPAWLVEIEGIAVRKIRSDWAGF